MAIHRQCNHVMPNTFQCILSVHDAAASNALHLIQGQLSTVCNSLNKVGIDCVHLSLVASQSSAFQIRQERVVWRASEELFHANADHLEELGRDVWSYRSYTNASSDSRG